MSLTIPNELLNIEIVIVDDAPNNLKLLSDLLKKEGYIVFSESSGHKALCRIKAKKPSLILLDVMMPDMDGFEVCRRLKEDESTCDIPVIFISALDDEESKLKGFRSGGVDYVSKPFRKEEVLARVKTQINLFRLHFELKAKNEKLENEILVRKQVEEALLESEERFRTTLYSIGDGVITTDKKSRVRLVNPVAEQLTGWSQAEASGKPLEEIFHIINENTRELVEVPVRKVIREGEIVGLPTQTLLISKDGIERPIADSAAPIRNTNDEIVGVVLVFRDQTEERIAENALKESEEKFRNFFENSPVGKSMIDIDGSIIVNKSLSDMLGYSLAELNTMKWMELTHPDDIQMTNDHIQLLLDRKSSQVSFEKRLIHKKGYIVCTDVSFYLQRDKVGNPQYFISSITDISQRKEAEKTLKESEEKFAKVFQNAPILISLVDLVNGTHIDVNEEALRLSGCTRDEIIGFKVSETNWISHEDLNFLVTEIQTKGKIIDIEMNFYAKSGRSITGLVRGESITLSGRDCILTTVVDITKRKQVEEAIKNERQLLRTLIDNLPDQIYIKDKDGRKMLANNADIENIGAQNEAEVLGKSDLELFDNKIGARGYADDLKVIQTSHPVINREEIFFDKNSAQRWLLTSKIPLIDQHGKTTGLVGIGRDITEQKKANETIQKLSKSIEQSPSIFVITDVLGNIEYVNPKFSEITGYKPEEVIGQNAYTQKSGEMPAEKFKELWDTITSGGVWRGEFHNRKKNGELYFEWAIITSIKNDSGVITNYIAIKEDISARKQMEIDLIAAKEKAEESDRLKSAFLANMSHEVRTPLNSIIGFSELLNDADFELDEKQEFVKHIINNGNNLLIIISDIMDISKMESGQITIRKNRIQLKKLLTEIKQQYFSKFQEKKLEFRLNVPELDNELYIYADVERLRQVLNNLIVNALKFTSKGFVQIEYKAVNGKVQFRIMDTGIGIPSEFHDKIFERFWQVESGITRKYGGNGLGLTISKDLVELMDGEIWVESEPGIGSVFYFTLPQFVTV